MNTKKEINSTAILAIVLLIELFYKRRLKYLPDDFEQFDLSEVLSIFYYLNYVWDENESQI